MELSLAFIRFPVKTNQIRRSPGEVREPPLQFPIHLLPAVATQKSIRKAGGWRKEPRP